MKRKGKQRRGKATLALLLIIVATISSASTWLLLTYPLVGSTAIKLNTSAQTASFGGFNPAAVYARSNQGVVLVEGTQITTDTNGPVTSSILGSGFVVTVNGTNYVITNFHMVVATSGLTVTFYDGNGYAARVLGTDAYSDLAVLTVARASQAEYHPLSLGPSGLAVVGEPVLAIGNPYGLTGSVTVGVISQPGRTIQESAAGNFSIADIIQFSAPINPGNSGGPLLDRDGRVIGITTASVASSQGLGFAIPSGTIIRELPYLITKAGITYIPTSE